MRVDNLEPFSTSSSSNKINESDVIFVRTSTLELLNVVGGDSVFLQHVEVVVDHRQLQRSSSMRVYGCTSSIVT